MTAFPFTLGFIAGAVFGIGLMVALIAFVNHGPGEKAWRHMEDEDQ